jgi:hypothetical protein
MNRRSFIHLSGLSSLPAVAGVRPRLFPGKGTGTNPPPVLFAGDGPRFSPEEYISLLGNINLQRPIKGDLYGANGTVAELLCPGDEPCIQG